MKSRIVLFALFISIILLTIPSISSLELSLVDNLNQKNEIFKKDILELFGKLSKDPAPKWFTLLFILIMFWALFVGWQSYSSTTITVGKTPVIATGAPVQYQQPVNTNVIRRTTQEEYHPDSITPDVSYEYPRSLGRRG